MKPSLQLRQSLQLTMTPQLQQAIKLLQLSSLELQTEIQTALESNPMLEQVESELDNSGPTQNTASESELSSHTDWQSQIQSLRGPKKSLQYNGNPMESLQGAEISLKDHLYWQMDLTPFTDTDKFIAENIIDSINEDGFIEGVFEDIIETIQKRTEVSEDEVVAVLHRIQQFDPVGVCARDLKECLNVQLQQLPEKTPWRDKAIELVSSYLGLLAKRDYLSLKRKLNINIEELRAVVQCIQCLNPRPGTKIGADHSEYIIPDVYAFKRNNKWQVEINPEHIPQIRINPQYLGIAKSMDSRHDSLFIRTQLQEARWFLKSLENRNDTLLKVAQCIIDAQPEFLEYGEEYMKPMILHDIAEKVAMHESTISRVTTQKYLHTPRGTFELKYFFSSGLDTAQGGECSSVAIRAFIKKLIEQEDLQKPLSDNKLAELLCAQGIKVARRTVAKYREAMTIPPSHERKQLL
jgi:RNA polymerase sigma-54 factor